jgi:hypothetical protein
MQPLGFAGLAKNTLDLRFINVLVSDSISDAIKAVLSEVKQTSQLKMSFREFEVPHTKPVQTKNFGYSSGVVSRQYSFVHMKSTFHASLLQVICCVVLLLCCAGQDNVTCFINL